MVGRPSIRLQPTSPLTSPHEAVNVITGSYAKTNFHQLSDTTNSIVREGAGNENVGYCDSLGVASFCSANGLR